MTAILESIHYFENLFEQQAENFAHEHPVTASAVIFICMPVLLVAGVAAFTTAVMLPVSALMGWL